MSYGLTRRQADLLQFIRAYVRLHGCSPSFEEMAEGLGIASKGQVHRLVSGLQERGAIDRMPAKSRSIIICESSASVLASHTTSCGTMRASDGGVDRTSRRSDHQSLSRRHDG